MPCGPPRTTRTRCGGLPPCSPCRWSPAASATPSARNRWASCSHGRDTDAAATGAARPETSGLGRDWQDRLAQWEKTGEHPALTLLDLGAIDPGEKKLETKWPDDLTLRLAAQGEKARIRLANLPARVQQGFQETRTLLAKKRAARPAAIRQGCCKAERALAGRRPRSSRAAPSQDMQVDPIAELQRIRSSRAVALASPPHDGGFLGTEAGRRKNPISRSSPRDDSAQRRQIAARQRPICPKPRGWSN